MAEAMPFHISRTHTLAGEGADPTTAGAALDPEDSILIFVLHNEAELKIELAGAAGELKDLVRLLRELLKLGNDAPQRLMQGVVLFAVFLQELAPGFKCRPAFVRRQQGKE